jgi:hypothetical protein
VLDTIDGPAIKSLLESTSTLDHAIHLPTHADVLDTIDEPALDLVLILASDHAIHLPTHVDVLDTIDEPALDHVLILASDRAIHLPSPADVLDTLDEPASAHVPSLPSTSTHITSVPTVPIDLTFNLFSIDMTSDEIIPTSFEEDSGGRIAFAQKYPAVGHS